MSNVKDMEKKYEESTEIAPKITETIRPMSSILDQIFEDFKRSVEHLMRPWHDIVPTRWFERTEPITWHPRVDLMDNGDSYTVTAEVPGLSKDQIQLSVTKDSLEICGEAKEEKEEKDRNYIRRERSYSSFRRFVAFPEEVIPDKAEAEMKKGILTVKVPKRTPTPKEEPVKIDIKEE